MNAFKFSLSLLDEWEAPGTFWSLANPASQVAGTLTFTPGTGVKLTIFKSFEPLPDDIGKSGKEIYNRIDGIIQGHYHVILLGCNDRGYNKGSGYFRANIRVQTALIYDDVLDPETHKSLFSIDKETYNHLEIEYYSLEHLLMIEPRDGDEQYIFCVSRNQSNSITVNKLNTISEPIEIAFNDKVLKIEYEIDWFSNIHQELVVKSVGRFLLYTKAKSYFEYLEELTSLENIAFLLMGSVFPIRAIRLVGRTHNIGDKYIHPNVPHIVKIWISQPEIVQLRRDEIPRPAFRLSDYIEYLPKIIEQCYNIDNEIGLLFNAIKRLDMETLIRIDTETVTLLHIIEAYINANEGEQRYISNEIRKEVGEKLQHLLNCIIPGFRILKEYSIVLHRLNNMFDFSLRDKLSTLINELPERIRFYIARDVDAFVRQVADFRNDYVHRFNSSSYEIGTLMKFYRGCYALVYAVAALELGFPESFIEHCIMIRHGSPPL